MSYFIFSFPRSEEEEVRTKNVWMKGHKGPFTFRIVSPAHSMTDIGSITLLWSQPVAALQIQTQEGWRWVRHIDNALVRTSPAIDPSASHYPQRWSMLVTR